MAGGDKRKWIWMTLSTYLGSLIACSYSCSENISLGDEKFLMSFKIIFLENNLSYQTLEIMFIFSQIDYYFLWKKSSKYIDSLK